MSFFKLVSEAVQYPIMQFISPFLYVISIPAPDPLSSINRTYRRTSAFVSKLIGLDDLICNCLDSKLNGSLSSFTGTGFHESVMGLVIYLSYIKLLSSLWDIIQYKRCSLISGCKKIEA